MGGSMLVMLAHGLSAGGLFAMIGMLYERCHTREIAAVGGVWTKMPRWSSYFLALSLAALGLPGLANFSGELLSLFGIFERGWAEPTGWATAYRVLTVAAVAGVVLGAWYMLWLVQRLLFNEFRWPSRQKVHGEAFSSTPEDIGSREVAAVLPLLLVSLWIGCWPAFFLDRMTPTLDQLTKPVAKVLTEREAAS